ncbi:cytochrome P450 [Mycena crocata]|nr:cytochrome P450 [Mycena crocata]
MECTAVFQLFSLFGKVVGVLAVVATARAAVWLVNLLVIAPRLDPLKNLPGPDASAFDSHFNEVNDPDITPVVYHDWTTNLFGKTFRYHGYGKHDYRLMSFDLRVLSHVLSSPIYEKPWQTRSYLGRLLGRGVFNMEGAEHKSLRKLIGPAFTSQAVRGFTPIFFQKAEELRDRWDALISANASTSCNSTESRSTYTTLDVAHWVSRTTFDIFGLAGLDYHFNALHDESEKVYAAYRTMFAISDKATKYRVLKQLYLPFLEKIWSDEDDKTTQRCLKTIRECGISLIQTKREAIMTEKLDFRSEEKDILSLLTKSNLSNEPASRLSDSELLDQLSSFLFAGSDSTALTITWCLHLLSQYPEIQNRLRAEIISAPTPTDSKRNSTSSVSSTSSMMQVDTIEALPFLDAVVRETLRVIPPVHGTVRVATADDLIPVSHPVTLRNGMVIHENEHIRIRKGSFVHIPLEGVNLSEDIWGSDAREFNPDRWASLPASAKPPAFPGLANVMSFSFAGHACPGYRFSVAEIKVIIATLLPQFVFSPVEGIEIGKYNSVLTRPFVRDQLTSGGIQLPLDITRYVE